MGVEAPLASAGSPSLRGRAAPEPRWKRSQESAMQVSTHRFLTHYALSQSVSATAQGSGHEPAFGSGN
jgi:hypothetical protein